MEQVPQGNLKFRIRNLYSMVYRDQSGENIIAKDDSRGDNGLDQCRVSLFGKRSSPIANLTKIIITKSTDSIYLISKRYLLIENMPKSCTEVWIVTSGKDRRRTITSILDIGIRFLSQIN